MQGAIGAVPGRGGRLVSGFCNHGELLGSGLLLGRLEGFELLITLQLGLQ
jgi:hypothetical protein